MEKQNFVIAVYVDNKAGVLTRVTAMFTRRGFNIDALTVGETEHSEYSRITIAMQGDEYVKAQLINQLKKLLVVKKVEVLDEEPIKRELMLIKVQNESKNRRILLQKALGLPENISANALVSAINMLGGRNIYEKAKKETEKL